MFTSYRHCRRLALSSHLKGSSSTQTRECCICLKERKNKKPSPLGRAHLMTCKKETINGEGTNAPLSVQQLVNAIAIYNRNNPSCVLTSATPPPPPPDVSFSNLCRRCRHCDNRCIASRCDDNFIVGDSNISLKGGGGEGEDLMTNNSWDPSSPSYCPPSLYTDPLLFCR